MAAHKLAFIVCSPRTGSTLLTRVLDSHSAIASPCEIPIPKHFRGDPSERLVADKLREICRFYQADFPRAWSDFDSLIEKILEYEQKELLVIKYPRHALFLELLVEDPRRSLKRTHPRSKKVTRQMRRHLYGEADK
jgi:Sulfotransferase family